MMRTLLPLSCAALFLTAACDQFSALKPGNDDEQARDTDDVHEDEGVSEGGVSYPRLDASVPSNPRDAAVRWDSSFPGYTCMAPSMMCDGFCQSVQSSRQHCGACHNACGTEEACVAGECVCATAGQVVCSGACTSSFLGICGECGEAEVCASEPTCDDGASHVADWPTLAGDLGRTGYNAGERGVPPLAKGWALSVTTTALNAATVAGQTVFVSGRVQIGETSELVALDLATGTQRWKRALGPVSPVSGLSYAACRLYVEHGRGTGAGALPARLWALDAQTGEGIWGKATDAYSAPIESPLVTDTAVYAGANSYAVERSNGAPLFEAASSSFGAGQSAFFDGQLFNFTGGKLQRRDGRSGVLLDTIGVDSSTSARPLLAPDGTAYLIGARMIYAFEVASKRLLWQAGSDVTSLALAEGRLLSIEAGVLNARDAKTGTALWRATGTQMLTQSPVVASGFVYVASATASFAVDLTTGAVVWQEVGGGALSVGGGRLLVAGSDGILRSYVLTQPVP